MYQLQQLLRYRLALNLNKEQMATLIGVNVEAISKWEGGECKVSPARRQKVAECYGITPEVLEEMCENLRAEQEKYVAARKSLIDSKGPSTVPHMI